MAPVLFLFLISAVSETLEDLWIQQGPEKSQLNTSDLHDHLDGQITSQPTKHKGMKFTITQI